MQHDEVSMTGLTRLPLAALVAATLGCGAAHAAGLITNGSFEASSFSGNTQFNAGFAGNGVTGWVNPDTNGQGSLTFYYDSATATTQNAVNAFGDPLAILRPGITETFTASPDGGKFVAFDSDPGYAGKLQQSISGLTPGSLYALSFYWAAGQLQNRTGATFDAFQVTFGSQTLSTPTINVPSEDFRHWRSETLTFTATSATQLLSFLAVGGPGGLPPVALLDGVSLNALPPSTVPEPASLGLIGLGIAGLGAVGLRRRGRAAA